MQRPKIVAFYWRPLYHLPYAQSLSAHRLGTNGVNKTPLASSSQSDLYTQTAIGISKLLDRN